MESDGIEHTLQKLTSRWFTEDFIKSNPDLVKNRLKQVIDTDPDVFLNVFKIYANTEMISWLNLLIKIVQIKNFLKSKKIKYISV